MVRQRSNAFGFSYGGGRQAGFYGPDRTQQPDMTQEQYEEATGKVKPVKKIKRVAFPIKKTTNVPILTPWSK